MTMSEQKQKEEYRALLKERNALRQLVRDQDSALFLMWQALRDNAGDTEDMDIRKNALATRVTALLGEEGKEDAN